MLLISQMKYIEKLGLL